MQHDVAIAVIEFACAGRWPRYDLEIFDAPDVEACLVPDEVVVPCWFCGCGGVFDGVINFSAYQLDCEELGLELAALP